MYDNYRDAVVILPEYMRDGVIDYIEMGWLPGSFLECILANDLFGATSRADTVNKKFITQYCEYFYSYAPSACWGSRQAVEKWNEIGGMKGLKKI